MEDFSWVKAELNYWNNPDCPRKHLEETFDYLVWETERVRTSYEHVKNMSEEELRERCEFYEGVLDKQRSEINGNDKSRTTS